MNTAPRILMIGPLPPPSGGQSILVRNLLESDITRDHPMLVLNIGHGPMGVARRLMLSMRYLLQLIFLLLRHPSLRVVHVHSSAGTPLFEKGLFILIAILWRKRVLLHMHGGRMRELWRRRSRAWRGVTRAIIGLSQDVIVLSDAWLPFYRDEVGYQGRLHCLPNSVPVEPGPAGRDDDRIHLLYVGHLKPEKGLLDLRQAWEELPLETRRRGKLILMGEGDSRANEQRIRAAFADLPPEEARFLGVLSGADKWAAFAQADILVLPSHSEDLPLTLLEGMALGLPLIATKVGAIPSLITDGREGILIEPRDVHELSRAMVELITARDLRAALGAAGKSKFDQYYSFERYQKKLADIYSTPSFPRENHDENN